MCRRRNVIAANAPARSNAIEFECLPRASIVQPTLPAPLPVSVEELLVTVAPPEDFGVVVEEPFEAPPVDDNVLVVEAVLGLPPVSSTVELDEPLEPPLWVVCTVEPVVALAPPVALPVVPPVAVDATVEVVERPVVPPVALGATVVAVVGFVDPPTALLAVVPTAEVPPLEDALVVLADVCPPVPVFPVPPAPASAFPPAVSSRE